MKNDKFFLVQQELQFHAKNPSNFGIRSGLSFVSTKHNPSCGDSITMAGNVQVGIVQDLCFEGMGCVICMASASKLTIAVSGMNIEQIRALDDVWMQTLLGLDLGPNRIKCAMLPLWALQNSL